MIGWKELLSKSTASLASLNMQPLTWFIWTNQTASLALNILNEIVNGLDSAKQMSSEYQRQHILPVSLGSILLSQHGNEPEPTPIQTSQINLQRDPQIKPEESTSKESQA